MPCPFPIRLARGVRLEAMKRALASLFGVQLGALLLTLWASVGIALGQNPESLQTLDALAPL